VAQKVKDNTSVKVNTNNSKAKSIKSFRDSSGQQAMLNQIQMGKMMILTKQGTLRSWMTLKLELIILKL
jgi:hypothetical protein